MLVPRGYHPVGAPHGYDLYYLNVMAGPKRVWRFHNDPEHEWLMKQVPGVNRQRVLVVGLGTMGLSHARAYQGDRRFRPRGPRAPATPPAAMISTRNSPACRASKA